MPSIETLLARMRTNPRGVRFRDAVRVASHFLGPPRVRGSHHLFSLPWAGVPMVNLQRDGDLAKPYQVRQLLSAIERLERERHA